MTHDQLIVIIGHFGVCALISYMMYIFFSSMFIPKGSKGYQIFVFALLATAIFYINTYNNIELNLAVTPILLFFSAWFTFKVSWVNLITFFIIFYAVFSGGKEVAFVLLNRLISSMYPEIYQKIEGPHGIFILIIEQLLGYFILLFTIQYTRKLKIGNGNQFSQYLLILPIATMFILSTFLYINFPDKVYIQVLMCLGAFLLYFSNITVFIILIKYAYILEKSKLAEMYIVKLDLEKKHYEKQEKSNERIRRFLHDDSSKNNNFRRLLMEGKSEEVIKIIDSIEGEKRTEIISTRYSSIPIFNAMLLERVESCRDKHIQIDVLINQTISLEFINPYDMMSMFGNLLDNAIEAAEKCTPGMRYVTVKLDNGGRDEIVFRIQNSFICQLKKHKGNILTTKNDKSVHGYGIGIVKMLANKYNGELELIERGEMVETILILSTWKKEE